MVAYPMVQATTQIFGKTIETVSGGFDAIQAWFYILFVGNALSGVSVGFMMIVIVLVSMLTTGLGDRFIKDLMIPAITYTMIGTTCGSIAFWRWFNKELFLKLY